jgi:hypothetical protein
MFVAALVGFGYGIAVVITFPQRHAPFWIVWMAFAVATATAAGALAGYGRCCWHELTGELKDVYDVRIPQVAGPVAIIAILGLALMVVPPSLAEPAHVIVRAWLVPAFALLGAVPAAGVMFGVRRAASDARPGATGDLVDLLMTLRRLLQRLLIVAGTVVALTTFTTGTWWLLEHSLHAPYGDRPPQFVLVFGAYGSLLVGVVYVPAWTAVQRRGQRIANELFPLRGINERRAILDKVGERQQLEQVLGLDRGILTDLQGGMIILAPLLAAAAAAFLPH